MILEIAEKLLLLFVVFFEIEEVVNILMLGVE